MKKETSRLADHLEITMNGEPWFGRSVFELLNEVDESSAFKKPNGQGHSCAELLYHMITWASFTEQSLLGNTGDLKVYEDLDWRTLDPAVHSWQKGVEELRSVMTNVWEMLGKLDDNILEQVVPGKKYNFRFLVTGMIEHSIYHLGQIAYISKFLR